MSNKFNSNMNQNLIELNKKVEIVNDFLSKNVNQLKKGLETKLANTNNDLNDLTEIIKKKEYELKQLKELYELLQNSKVVCEQLSSLLKDNEENKPANVNSEPTTNYQEPNNGIKQPTNDPRLSLATKYKNKIPNVEVESNKNILSKCLSFKTIDYEDENNQNNAAIAREEIKSDTTLKQVNLTELKILEFLNNLQVKSQTTGTTATVTSSTTSTTTTTNNGQEAMDTIVDAENISLFESPMLDVSFKKQENLLDDTLNATQASLNLIILQTQQANNNLNEEINDVNSPPTPTLPQGDEDSEYNDAINYDNPIAGNLVQKATNTVSLKDGKMKIEKNRNLENILMKRVNSFSKIIEDNIKKLKADDDDDDEVETRNKFIMDSMKSLISYDFCKNKNKQKSGDLKVEKFKKKALTTSTPACSSHNLIGSNNNRRPEETDLIEMNEYLFNKIKDECSNDKTKQAKSKLDDSIDIYGDLDAAESDANKTITNQKLLDESLFDNEIFKSDDKKRDSNTNSNKNCILNEIKNENTQKTNNNDDKNRSNKDDFKVGGQSKTGDQKPYNKDRYDHRNRLNSHHHHSSSSSHSPSTNRKDRDRRSPFTKDYRTPDKHNERSKTDNNKKEYDSKYDRKRYDSPSTRSNDDSKKRKLSPKRLSNTQSKQAKWK